MVTEQHLTYDSGKIYTKHYAKDSNSSVLVLIPGQSLSPRAFWDFELVCGKTHSEIFCDNGLDVLLIDPLGYGSSVWGGVIENYDRDYYAKQISFVCDSLTKSYVNKTIFGFSTSTAPAMIASQTYFNKLCLHSPALLSNSTRSPDKFVPSGSIVDGLFKTNLQSLKEARLATISDKLIGSPNRMPCWEPSLKKVIETFSSYEDPHSWSCPYGPIEDLSTYYPLHKNHGYNRGKIPKQILTISGQYDAEVTLGMGYRGFKMQRLASTDVVIPDSTHFSMWENRASETRENILKYCLTIIPR